MLSNLSFGNSRFVINKPYTLPLDIPLGCNDAVVFSLKTQSIYDSKIYLWNPKTQIFMLEILYLWEEINPVFAKIEKSRIYKSDLTEIYCLTMRSDFTTKFDTLQEAIAHGRLLLELAIEKGNNDKVSQMDYLTVYEYLETIEIFDLLKES